MPVDPGTGSRRPKPKPQPKRTHTTADAQRERIQIQRKREGRAVDPPAWVISRQRLLRAKGYGVVVDGIWGPRSQAAWSQYQKRKNAPPRPADTARDKSKISTNTTAVRKQRDAARRIAERKQRMEMLRQKAKVAAETARARARQQATESARSRVKAKQAEHTTLLRQKRDEVERRKQDIRKTRIEGVGLTPRPPKPDPQVEIARVRENTGMMMMRIGQILAGERANKSKGKDRVERSLTPDQLRATLFDPEVGSFDVQSPDKVQIVQEYLRGKGFSKLAVDGIYGEQTHRALVAEFERELAAERARQTKMVTDTFYKTGILKVGGEMPFLGKTPTPEKLLAVLNGKGDNFTGALLWRWLLAEARTLGPTMLDPKFTAWQEDFLRKQLAAVYGPFYETLKGVRDVKLDALTAAPSSFSPYINATNFADLRRRLAEQKKIEQALIDQRYRESLEKGFWSKAAGFGGDALDALAAPAIWTKKMIVTTALALGPTSAPGVQYPTMDVTEAIERSEVLWADLERDHPWINLGLEILVDPLNFVGVGLVKGAASAPFRAVSRGAVELEKVGVKLDDAGRIAGITPVLKAPARAGRWADKTLDDLAEAAVIHPTMGRAYGAYKRATRLKVETVRVARRRVKQAAYNGFRPVARIAGSEKVRMVDEAIKGVTTETRAALAETGNAVARLAHAPAPKTLELLSKIQGSIFVDAARSDFSTVGWQLRSAIAADLEATAVRRIATEQADEIVANTLAHDEKYLRLTREAPEAADEYLANAREVAFNRTIREYGTWFTGSGDPTLRRLVKDRTKAYIAELETVLLPAWQDFLEASGRAAKMFDAETGKWTGIGGAQEIFLKTIARQAFDYVNRIVIKNPNYGKHFDLDRADELIEEEVGRRAASLRASAAIEEASGRPKPDGWVDDQLEEAEREIRSWWKRTADGKITDTRKTLAVPVIHLRSYLATVDDAAGITDESLEELIARVKKKNPEVGEYVESIYLGPENPNNTWRRKGQFVDDAKQPVSRDEATDFIPGDYLDYKAPIAREITRTREWLSGGVPEVDPLDPFLGRPFRGSTAEAQGALQREFQASVRAHRETLQRASTEALSGVLRSEGAYWQALKHTQRSWARGIYYTAYGGLQTWRFATLPLRPGWVVRNVTDNTLKVLLQGVVDPRYWFVGAARPGTTARKVRSIFEIGIVPLRASVRHLDEIFGTKVGQALDSAFEHVWAMSTDSLKKLFWMHDIHVPRKVLDQMKHLKEGDDESIRFLKSFREKVWELAGDRPESYYRRVLYRATYAKAIKRGADDFDATKQAWAAVERTLFDYSKISTVEDNFRIFAPFIQFWRKNTTFWTKTAVGKPWFLADVGRFEEALDQQNEHLPEWMRRYVDVSFLSDVTARVPGLRWMADGLRDAKYDPLNFFSFAPLYRSFKNENPLLPPEQAGLPFISGLVDGMSDFGLGTNPLLRKPLEMAGVLNIRHWQTMFPQTSLIQAFTRKFWSDRFPNGLNIEAMLTDPLFELMGKEGSADSAARAFNEYVNREIANQVLRGEEADREAAEKKIRDWLLVQSVVGYFTGTYLRSIHPEDVHLYQLGEAMHKEEIDFLNLSKREQDAYALFKRRGWDVVAFERYREMVPLVQAYYSAAQEDFEAAEQFKLDHPQILEFVEPILSGKIPGVEYVQTQALIADSDAAIEMFDLVDALDLDPGVTKLAEELLVPPALRYFWSQNDTPKERRDKQVRGAYHRYLKHLSDTFNAIPSTDYAAREGFLDQHPELVRWWNANNDAADDYKVVLQAVTGDLRDLYFEAVDAGDWKRAGEILRQFPMTFDHFEDEDFVFDRETGRFGGSAGRKVSERARAYLAAKTWLDHYFSLPKSQRAKWLRSGAEGAGIVQAYFDKYGRSNGGKPRSQKARDYLAAKDALDLYFGLPKEKRGDWLRGGSPEAKAVKDYFRKYASEPTTQKGKDFANAQEHLERYFKLSQANPDKAREWLNGPSDAAKIVLRYFRKYPSKSQHAKDYAKVKDHLTAFFAMSDNAQGQWLRSGSEEAKLVQAYFDKYASKKGTTAQARAYLAAKDHLDTYFALPESDRAAWLHSGKPGSEKVLDYFKRFGKSARIERSFREQNKELMASRNGELATRLAFWQRYFALDPRQRIAFVAQEAESAGVFIYGALGDRERHDREAEWMRRAYLARERPTDKALAYIYVKPLLDFLFTLSAEEKPMFLRANPDLAEYLDKYGEAKLSGDPQLDAVIEGYFKLPFDSDLRSRYLREHPEVQHYFDERSTPNERAIRALLTVYFEIRNPRARKSFLREHPEVQEYFDKRQEERRNERRALSAFDLNDPRLRPFREAADRDLRPDAERMRASLKQRKELGLEVRTSRRPTS